MPSKQPHSGNPEQAIAQLQSELADVHAELQNANTDLIQLTMELEDRVDARTRALRKSEKELRRHRDHLQERVAERTQELRRANQTLEQNLNRLKASEERFRSLVLTIPDIVYRIDRNGYFTFINDAIQKLGYDARELQGRHFSEIVRPAEVDRISRKKVLPQYRGRASGDEQAPKLFDERRTGNRRTTALEVRLLAKNQQFRPGLIEGLGPEEITVEINSAGLYESLRHENKEHLFVGTVGVIRDISDRKRFETALKESEERLKTILAHAHTGIVVVDAQTHGIVEANPAAVSMIGAAKEKIIGRVCHTFICSSEKGACPITDLNQDIDNAERMLKQADGRERPILKTVARIQLDGRPHLVESFVDISRLKQVEGQLEKARDDLEAKVAERTQALRQSQAKLIESEKTAALGVLTAGIAHELNNPMMGMLNFIQYCLKHTDPQHRTYDILKDAEHETRRCTKIVNNLLTFARIKSNDDAKPELTYLPDLVDRVCRLLSYRMEKENVCIVKEFDPHVSPVVVKSSAIQQVILNLVSNALDAMADADRKELRFELDQTSAGIRIQVHDSGSGIPSHQMAKIFDPFFTTKPVGKGTGLGLALSLSIVEEHGGRLRCHSEPGRGTTFDVLLPHDINLACK